MPLGRIYEYALYEKKVINKIKCISDLKFIGRVYIMKKKFNINWIYIILFLLLQAILFLYSWNAYKQFKSTKQTSYQYIVDDAEDYFIKPSTKHTFQLKAYADHMVQCNIWTSADTSGELQVTVFRKNEIVYDKILQGKEISDNNVIIIDGIELDYGVYTVDIESHLKDDIRINASEGYIVSQTEYFKAEYDGYVLWVMVTFHVFLAILSLLFYFIRNTDVKYLMGALILGMICVFVTVPLSVPDEMRHFLRAYDIAMGEQCVESQADVEEMLKIGILGSVTSCFVPEEILEIKNLSKEKHSVWTAEHNKYICIPRLLFALKQKDSGKKTEMYLLGTDQKTFVDYWPQIIFIRLGSLLKLPIFWLFYIARIGNMLISNIIIWFSIKTCKECKNILYIWSMTPCFMLLKSSCSTDALLFSITVALICLFLNRVENENVIDAKFCVALLVVSYFIATLKLPYILPIFVFTAIKFKNKKKDFGVRFNYIFIAVILAVSYFLRTITFKVGMGAFADSVNGQNAMYALNYIFSNIMDTISLLGRHLLDTLWYYVSYSVNWPMEDTLLVFYVVLLVIAIVIDGAEKLTVKQRVILITCVGVIWCGVVALAYLLMSDVASNEISGLQLRYMTPLLGYVFVALSRKQKNRMNVLEKYLPMTLFHVNMLTVVSYITKFWIP